MDIYEDRAEWQMNDHMDYELYPLDWPENVFGEELGGGNTSDEEFHEQLEQDDPETEATNRLLKEDSEESA